MTEPGVSSLRTYKRLRSHDRGPDLQRDVQKLMNDNEYLDDSEKIKMNSKKLLEEVLVWFKTGESYALPTVSERLPFYKSMFTLTTNFEVRDMLIENGVLRTLSHWLIRDGDAVLLSALSNLMVAKEVKKSFIEEFDGIKFYVGFLSSEVPHVVVHACRGIFAISTETEYKIKFVEEIGFLTQFVGLLHRNDVSLSTQVIGALGNIAIHPKAKLPISATGVLTKLKEIVTESRNESMLHHSARLLFSLSVEAVVRKSMLDLMDCIKKLLGFVDNSEILLNTIGLCANLAIELGIPIVTLIERIVSIFMDSKEAQVDRQIMRLLFMFCSNDRVRITKSLVRITVLKIGSTTDHYFVRDAFGFLACVTKTNVEARGWLFEYDASVMAFMVWDKFHEHEDLLCNVLRMLFSLCNTNEECTSTLDAIRIQKISVACGSSKGLVFRKLAFGFLGKLSNVESMKESLKASSALTISVNAFFDGTIPHDTRECAGKVICGLTGFENSSFVEDSMRFGASIEGEADRLNADFRGWVNDTSFARRDFIVHCVKTIANTVTVSLFEPLMFARFPTVLAGLQTYRVTDEYCGVSELPSVSQSSWNLFVELIHSPFVKSAYGVDTMRDVITLAKAMGVMGDDDGLIWSDFKTIVSSTWNSAVDRMLLRRTGMNFRVEPTRHDEMFAPKERSSFMESLIERWTVYDDETSSSRPKRLCRKLESKTVHASVEPEILAARSSYFAGLIRGSWDDNEIKSITFDGSVDALVVVIRYLHFGYDVELRVELTQNLALCAETMRIAHRYGMLGLQHQCEYVLARALFDDSKRAIRLICDTRLMHLQCLRLIVYADFSTESYKFEKLLSKNPVMKDVFQNAGLCAI